MPLYQVFIILILSGLLPTIYFYKKGNKEMSRAGLTVTASIIGLTLAVILAQQTLI